MRLQYNCSITNIVSKNSSFDACTIQICYHGKNRNKSRISKDTIIKALPSLANCPIVCNYDAENDTIGGHDVEIVKTGSQIRMINKTDAIGVVPSGAESYWLERYDDGVLHEYICTDAILWKRSAAYQKVKSDSITSQSMEINVNSGSKAEDGYYDITDFEFTALCLLGEGITPCFEDASLETFDFNELGNRMSEMMDDFKLEFSKVMTASADDINTQPYLKGGKCGLDVNELMLTYGLSAEDIDFDMTNMEINELKERFEMLKNQKANPTANFEEEADADPSADTGAADDGSAGSGDEPENADGGDDGDDDAPKKKDYSLTSEQFFRELTDSLNSVMYNDPLWGEMRRYWYVDYDMNAMEVYAIDEQDSKLYGFKFSMNGDHVVIDFETCKRKKTSFVDFDEGDQTFAEETGHEAMFVELRTRFMNLAKETNELREFKRGIDAKARKDAEDALFAKFADMSGNEMFEALKLKCKDMSMEQLEEKLFAIRGRISQAKFSLENPAKPMRLPIEESEDPKTKDEPYGGIFLKYGFSAK